MSPDSIPIIDFGPFLTDDPRKKKTVALALGQAFERYGFLTLVGHGIPKTLIDRVREVAGAFFNLSEAEKKEVLSRPKSGMFCGYVPFALDSAAVTYQKASAPPDLRERYRSVCSEAEEVRAKVGANQWPRTPGEFESVWRRYYLAMENLAANLIRACALALDLPENHLDRYFDRHFSVLVAAQSPRIEVPVEADQYRCGEHCDFGTLTLVHQAEGAGGLQIRSKRGWVDVETDENAFVVNIGDLMARWTNDRWVSTRHRVALPTPSQNRTGPRLSMIYFNQPNLRAEMTCLETCQGPGNPPKYPPTTIERHFSEKQAKLTARQKE